MRFSLPNTVSLFLALILVTTALTAHTSTVTGVVTRVTPSTTPDPTKTQRTPASSKKDDCAQLREAWKLWDHCARHYTKLGILKRLYEARGQVLEYINDYSGSETDFERARVVRDEIRMEMRGLSGVDADGKGDEVKRGGRSCEERVFVNVKV